MDWAAWEGLYDQALKLYEAEPTQAQFYIMVIVLAAAALMLQGLVSLIYLPATIRNAWRRGSE
jgi:hypothetical protein